MQYALRKLCWLESVTFNSLTNVMKCIVANCVIDCTFIFSTMLWKKWRNNLELLLCVVHQRTHNICSAKLRLGKCSVNDLENVPHGHNMWMQKLKSNYTVKTVRVEANQPGTSATCDIFYRKCKTRKCFTVKLKVRVTDYIIHNNAIRWRTATSEKVIWRILAIALTCRDTIVSNLWPDSTN